MHALKCIFSYAFAESTYAERSYRSFPYLATVSRVPFSPSSHRAVSLKQTKWRRPLPPACFSCMNDRKNVSCREWKIQRKQINVSLIFLWIRLSLICVILVELTLDSRMGSIFNKAQFSQEEQVAIFKLITVRIMIIERTCFISRSILGTVTGSEKWK